MKKLAVCLLMIGITVAIRAQETESRKLHALFEREWQWTLESYPTFASFLGDKRYNSRWEDRSLTAIAARNRRSVEALAELKKIDRAKLSTADRVNYDLFQNSYESSITICKKKENG